ncbi:MULTISPECIES: hypothetical protein [Kitasatospora]|uniref:hypothetical protein n=1 Tax=Kitasatospora TaxID=2063 RepID=UPI0031D7A81F
MRELTERHRSVCEQTVAPLAIAAGLAGAGPGPGPTGTAAAFRARTRPVLLVAIGLHPALPAVLSFAALAVLAALDPGPAAGAGLPAAAVGRVSALLPPCAWAVLGRPGGYRPAAPPL